MVARIYKALSHVGNLTQFGVLFSSFVIVMTSMKRKTFLRQTDEEILNLSSDKKT